MKNMDSQDFKVRDLRKKEQFIIDDVYLNGYAKIFGAMGTAVYLSLCRRADKRQSCWPSEAKIAEDHGLTDRTVRKYIKMFERANLIRIERERSATGKWLHNVYYLLDKSEWKKPEEIISAGCHGKIKAKPEEKHDTSRRKQVPPKDAQEKEAQKKDDPVKKSFDENHATTLEDFEPKNSDESRCWEIAKWLREENMNFILYCKKRYGIQKVEQAYGIVKEDVLKKVIGNRGSYFNAVMRNLAAGRK